MKVVLNKCYGGFSISKEYAEKLNMDIYCEEERFNPVLIAAVENDPEGISGRCADLIVVTIPDNNTDYRLIENDGYENLIYVVDGKIYFA